MRKLIVANWKENPVGGRAALRLFSGTAKIKRGANTEVVICPPNIYLESISKQYRALSSKSGLALGAQDVFWEESGAHTGEVGVQMQKSLGVEYVIVGHSERRRLGETDEMIHKKMLAVREGGLKAILCVGESLEVRKKGVGAAKKFVKNQLHKNLKGFVSEARPKAKGSVIIAYEPIWAIGTGNNCPPEDAVDMAKFIKKEVTSIINNPHSIILYGGSVNGKNSMDYVLSKDIGGALVGGASLKIAEFAKIIKSSASADE